MNDKDNKQDREPFIQIPLLKIFVFFVVVAILSSFVASEMAFFGAIARISGAGAVITAIAGVFKLLFIR